MVGFLHSPTSEEAKENKKGLQNISDLNKQQINPSEFFFSDSEDSSSAFVDSLLNFDGLGDWTESGPESLFYMAYDDPEANPSEVSLGNAKNAVCEKNFILGCDGLSERSQLKESFVEKDGKTVSVTRQEKGVEDCGNFSREKDFDRDEAGNMDDFGYLIEEEMGKVTLDSVSSCLVPNTEDDSKREGIGGGWIQLNENVTKCNGDDGSDIKIAVVSSDHPPSESEEETSSLSSETSSSSDDDEEKKDFSRDKKGKSVTWLRGRNSSKEEKNDVEVEMEEGEIIASGIGDGETIAWSGDEDDEDGNVSGGSLRSENELKVLPHVPPVNVTLQPHHQTLPVGIVLSIVGAQVIVEGVEKHNPLDEGSILWITQTRSPLGMVDEIFGPVKNPYYIIRHNSESEVPSGLKPGDSVCFVQEFANHILNDKSLYAKAYDASGANDEEVSEEEEFSDDEKEAEYKKMLKMKKRGNNFENIEKKKVEPKTNSGNWKHDHGSQQHKNHHQHHVPPVVPTKPDLGNNDQHSSSNIGHDSNVRPGFRPPFSQLGQNPSLSMQSAGPNVNSFQLPLNIGVAGFPTNNVPPWFGQVNPQMLYQMNMQNGLATFGQQQIGMNPAFTPWPTGYSQNMFDPSFFAMAAAQGQQQQLPNPFNGGHQAFPFNNLQQIGYNSGFNMGMATASQPPEMSAISSQGAYQNLSQLGNSMACSSSVTAGTTQFGMAGAPVQQQQQQQQHSFLSGIEQMGFNSSMKPNTGPFGRPDMSPSSNQGRGGGNTGPFGRPDMSPSPNQGRGGGNTGPFGRLDTPPSSNQGRGGGNTGPFGRPDTSPSPNQGRGGGNTGPFGRPDTSPSPNQGRGGGRQPHRMGRGGGRFGCGRFGGGRGRQ